MSGISHPGVISSDVRHARDASPCLPVSGLGFFPEELQHHKLQETQSHSSMEDLSDRVDALFHGAIANVRLGSEIIAQGMAQTASASKDRVEATIKQSLEYIGADPTAESTRLQKAVTILFEIMPVLRGMKEYASARDKFLRGTSEDRPDLIRSARREFLGACVTMGMDLTVLGAAPLLVKYQAAFQGLTRSVAGIAPVMALSFLAPFRKAASKLLDAINPQKFIVRTLSESGPAATVADTLLALIEAK